MSYGQGLGTEFGMFARGARPLSSFLGGTNFVTITSATGTTRVDVLNDKPWAVAQIINSGAAQTNAVWLYDLYPGEAIGSTNPIYKVTLTAAEVLLFHFPLQIGLAIIPQGAVGANVIVSYWS